MNYDPRDFDMDDFLYNCEQEKKLLEEQGFKLSEGKFKHNRMFYNILSKHECPFAEKVHKKAPLYIVLNPDYTGENKCRHHKRCHGLKQCFTMKNRLPPDVIADYYRDYQESI